MCRYKSRCADICQSTKISYISSRVYYTCEGRKKKVNGLHRRRLEHGEFHTYVTSLLRKIICDEKQPMQSDHENVTWYYIGFEETNPCSTKSHYWIFYVREYAALLARIKTQLVFLYRCIPFPRASCVHIVSNRLQGGSLERLLEYAAGLLRSTSESTQKNALQVMSIYAYSALGSVL